MTILPKKKQNKDKCEGESRDPPRSPPGESSRLGHNTRRQGPPSPPRWNNAQSRDDPSLDPGGSRFDAVHSHELSQNHNKKRHRSSPHRTGRKHRHCSHQPNPDRTTSRQERQNAHQLWVEPTPGTSHANLSPLSHESHLPYSEITTDSIENDEGGYNSEDEYSSSQPVIPQVGKPVDEEELERCFETTLKEKRGFLIKRMGEDGACMFRAVADQVFGDQEMHSIVRRNCVDYMAKNAEFFSQYVTEDFHSYLNRKRSDHCHGNHVEMQAMCELYNRPIEVFQYSIDPINTFHGAYKPGNAPIRLSYHGNHYNSVVDPMKATIGVGLGLPGLQPGAADRNLMTDAKRVSENVHIEKTMLEDKMRETDWEMTQESIEEQVARESYLQWLRDQEKRAKSQEPSASASAACSSSTLASAAPAALWEPASVPPPAPPLPASQLHHSPGRSPPPHTAPSLLDTLPMASCSQAESPTRLSPPTSQLYPTNTTEQVALLQAMPVSPKPSTSNTQDLSGGATAKFSETASIMNTFSPELYGLSDWDEDDIMAQVIAQSQQEYMDTLRKSAAPSSSSSATSHSAHDS